MGMEFVKPDRDYETIIRICIPSSKTYKVGELMNSSHTTQYVEDVATNLCLLYSGNEGECKRYEKLALVGTTYSGDFVEIVGKIIGVNSNELKIQAKAFKIAENARIAEHESAVNILEKPVIILDTVSIYEILEK